MFDRNELKKLSIEVFEARKKGIIGVLLDNPCEPEKEEAFENEFKILALGDVYYSFQNFLRVRDAYPEFFIVFDILDRFFEGEERVSDLYNELVALAEHDANLYHTSTRLKQTEALIDQRRAKNSVETSVQSAFGQVMPSALFSLFGSFCFGEPPSEFKMVSTSSSSSSSSSFSLSSHSSSSS